MKRLILFLLKDPYNGLYSTLNRIPWMYPIEIKHLDAQDDNLT